MFVYICMYVIWMYWKLYLPFKEKFKNQPTFLIRKLTSFICYFYKKKIRTTKHVLYSLSCQMAWLVLNRITQILTIFSLVNRPYKYTKDSKLLQKIVLQISQ